MLFSTAENVSSRMDSVDSENSFFFQNADAT